MICKNYALTLLNITFQIEKIDITESSALSLCIGHSVL